MQASEIVEISSDNLRMRPKEGFSKWPISGPSFTFSNLNADVPEFVPGQPFTLPVLMTSQSQDAGGDSGSGDVSDASRGTFGAYATPVLSSSAPELEGNWQQVKKKSKERTPKRPEVSW